MKPENEKKGGRNELKNAWYNRKEERNNGAFLFSTLINGLEKLAKSW